MNVELALAVALSLSCKVLSQYLLDSTLDIMLRKYASEGSTVSSVMDRIFEMWVPRPLCRPAHSRQTSTPKLTDAQVGLARPQSAQFGLVLRAQSYSLLRISFASRSLTCDLLLALAMPPATKAKVATARDRQLTLTAW